MVRNVGQVEVWCSLKIRIIRYALVAPVVTSLLGCGLGAVCTHRLDDLDVAARGSDPVDI